MSKGSEMFSLEIVLMGLALAIDAAVVTFAISLLHKNFSAAKKANAGILTAGAFGLSQFLMLWLGSYCGYLFTYSSNSFFFQLSISLIFLGLAVKCFYESFRMDTAKVRWGIFPLVIFAVATSIDALASGISLGTLPNAYLAALEVGLITFCVCGFFYFIGQFFTDIPDRWLLRFAALIFAFLGADIYWNLRSILLRG